MRLPAALEFSKEQVVGGISSPATHRDQLEKVSMNGRWGCVHFFDGLIFLPIDLSRTVPTTDVVKELGARTDLS